MRVGLTGGIGSGKSTVAAFLGQCGAAVVDADAISRAATATGGSAIASISAAFGTDMIDATGALDRVKMRAKVFQDIEARKLLESIIHPLVGAAIETATREAQTGGARCVVLDIPLLVESAHWRKRLDKVLVVDCSNETQIRRVVQRNALQAREVQAVIDSQAPRLTRLAASDCVIFNEDLSLLQLEAVTRQMGAKFGL
ncbi:dephospho-CoA kinase [Rhodoferax sp. TBRC 17198]|uniref:dephospho-CoA kinase n=1 Tax=Rhodoferax potami TaxID=3068338 RepID=UPI0028BE525A|nr:dephospho-CoA kinase [Rhodoferax sp. TBRC 17198]MDT7522984.1 dephospho-CoA kinase [Rhodoferax sp. TBRC 17198]